MGIMTPIVTASELADELAGPRPPLLLDVRYEMGGPPGREPYAAGHLPGAVYVDLDTELAGTPGTRGRHPLPDVAAFGAVMRRAGISGDSSVVVYDGGQGWAAARAWWLLRWTGHEDVRVLDGGVAGWSGPLSTELPVPEQGDFSPVPGALPVLDADGAAALARDGLLLDARAAERFRGEVEPVDRVAGHIPGAVSAPTAENVAQDGRFRPPGWLTSRFAALGATEKDRRVGVYCGSGVSAAHEVLALEIAGIPAALYVGSWSEWSEDTGRPVAKGPGPR
jgi:thiosulfate/3-mercaptopyruvate sulfurtransferase